MEEKSVKMYASCCTQIRHNDGVKPEWSNRVLLLPGYVIVHHIYADIEVHIVNYL
jgi:hypothetical protein